MVTERFTARNAAPGRVNGSALGQIPVEQRLHQLRAAVVDFGKVNVRFTSAAGVEDRAPGFRSLPAIRRASPGGRSAFKTKSLLRRRGPIVKAR